VVLTSQEKWLEKKTVKACTKRIETGAEKIDNSRPSWSPRAGATLKKDFECRFKIQSGGRVLKIKHS